ncbi:uncharacterized protein LOC105238956 [Ailuropoda melanoleuca]|uniref:uncharacterized protein LOC105238956 n=1 Tax=Ailuropoda melanoleuca TaxID=9646 RepID=UPI000947EFA4|nr:uncharacterized protein LOC105238956 [Ailuropoda melanoleuca]
MLSLNDALNGRTDPIARTRAVHLSVWQTLADTGGALSRRTGLPPGASGQERPSLDRRGTRAGGPATCRPAHLGDVSASRGVCGLFVVTGAQHLRRGSASTGPTTCFGKPCSRNTGGLPHDVALQHTKQSHPYVTSATTENKPTRTQVRKRTNRLGAFLAAGEGVRATPWLSWEAAGGICGLEATAEPGRLSLTREQRVGAVAETWVMF